MTSERFFSVCSQRQSLCVVFADIKKLLYFLSFVVVRQCLLGSKVFGADKNKIAEAGILLTDLTGGHLL